jgi:hypothetical protein
MLDAGQFMMEVLAMWTETDRGLRRGAIEAHFHDDARLYDPDGEYNGHDGVERLSDSLQGRFPDARFRLAEPPRQVADAIRAYWHFGSSERPRAVTGMDFIILDGGKARTLYALLDPA